MSYPNIQNEKGLETSHYEDIKVDNEIVVDAEAKGYVDHNIVIDEETNRRLRRMINFR